MLVGNLISVCFRVREFIKSSFQFFSVVNISIIQMSKNRFIDVPGPTGYEVRDDKARTQSWYQPGS